MHSIAEVASPLPRSLRVVDESSWHAQRDAHHSRVDAWITPRLQRRARGLRHPVEDFLFDYYSFRPALLRRWHPGLGIGLQGDAGSYLEWRGYVTIDGLVTVEPSTFNSRLADVRQAISILESTRARTPQFGCLGLHEWAMVYRIDDHQLRHSDWPLRLSPEEIAHVVTTQGLRCTHFDAFRFFTRAALPLNTQSLSRADQVEREQGGCLHANMDLYKWAFMAVPLIDSDLVADCFDLALRIRAVDMRASPYDFRTLGYEAITLETSTGRAEYVAAQRIFVEEADVLRGRLLTRLIPIRDALTVAGSAEATSSKSRESGSPSPV